VFGMDCGANEADGRLCGTWVEAWHDRFKGRQSNACAWCSSVVRDVYMDRKPSMAEGEELNVYAWQ
jgi:hypothetical protein